MDKSLTDRIEARNAEIKRFADQGHEVLDSEMAVLCATKGNLVTSWITNEIALGKLSFEEAAVQLARNFMTAHISQEMIAAGRNLEDAKNPDREKDAA